MTIIEGYIDEFDFSQCSIAGFSFLDRNLIVNIDRHLSLLENHPLCDRDWTKSCQLIFTKVITSVREFYEYDESLPRGYKPARKIVDRVNYTANLEDNIVFEDFYLEGVLLKYPQGWLSWEIRAEKFYFDDLKD